MKAAIVGIHTGIGKTIASAVICEALQSDYWKPVQAGSLQKTDSDTVRMLISNDKSVIHPEGYRLKEPMSPHAAAAMERIKIELKSMKLPVTDNHLIVETAGGLMSPLNDRQTNLDLIKHFNLPVILASQNYLGSINHSLLTIEVMKANKIKILGVLFNGAENVQTQDYISRFFKLPVLGRMNHRRILTKESIQIEAQNIKTELKKIFSTPKFKIQNHAVLERENDR